MTRYLLDTNVVSEFIKKKTNQKVLHWVDSQDDELLYISLITIGELWRGFTLLPPSKRRSTLEAWFHNELMPWFDGRILPLTKSSSIRWGILQAERQLKGTPLATEDGLIAATALEHGLTVVTRNTKDFDDLGINLFNPWEE